MATKRVPTYLSKELCEILDRMCTLTGNSASQVLRDGLLIYAKDIGVLNERVLKTMKVT